jgi:hypothetical protein
MEYRGRACENLRELTAAARRSTTFSLVRVSVHCACFRCVLGARVTRARLTLPFTCVDYRTEDNTASLQTWILIYACQARHENPPTYYCTLGTTTPWSIDRASIACQPFAAIHTTRVARHPQTLTIAHF